MARKNILRLSDDERRLLARPAFFAGLAFAILLLLVLTGLINSLDQSLVSQLHVKQLGLRDFFRAIEIPGQRRIVYPFAIMVGVLFTFRRKDLLPLIATVSALVFTNAVTGMFKILTLRAFPRNELGPEIRTLPIWDADKLGAFPSGHGANVAAVCTLLVLAAFSARPRWRPFAPAIAGLTLIPISAVFVSSWALNFHWMSDLFAGLALGICTTIVAALWASHLPDHWRHPELVGKRRSAGALIVLGTMGVIFMFAGNSFLQESYTSGVLVVGTLVVIAYLTSQSITRRTSKK
ncbi:MAG: phosphatase PAP2 family protein [Actinobacteria bacterium]|nr:phosphatase PAP2 family protein [Actinomycetota bacterium]